MDPLPGILITIGESSKLAYLYNVHLLVSCLSKGVNLSGPWLNKKRKNVSISQNNASCRVVRIKCITACEPHGWRLTDIPNLLTRCRWKMMILHNYVLIKQQLLRRGSSMGREHGNRFFKHATLVSHSQSFVSLYRKQQSKGAKRTGKQAGDSERQMWGGSLGLGITEWLEPSTPAYGCGPQCPASYMDRNTEDLGSYVHQDNS